MRRPMRSASTSSTARWSALPEVSACMRAPPSDSSSASSPVAIFTSGGPPRNTLARCSTITVWSLMPGRYAPPAVLLPNTSASDGMPAAERRVMSRNPRPPGTKISPWVGRSAPRGLDERDGRQPVLGRDLRGAVGLAQRVRVHRAAADRGVVRGDEHLDAGDDADARDEGGAERELGAPGRERRELEERAVAVEQQLDALAGGELAAGAVAGEGLLAAGGDGRGVEGGELLDGGERGLAVRPPSVGAVVRQAAVEDRPD